MDRQMSLVPVERIERAILLIRGQKVLLSQQLAELYGVETKVLNQAVARNRERFPDDFMFQLSREELENLKSQIVTSSWGGVRTPPYAFTEQGVTNIYVNGLWDDQYNVTLTYSIRTSYRTPQRSCFINFLWCIAAERELCSKKLLCFSIFRGAERSGISPPQATLGYWSEARGLG